MAVRVAINGFGAALGYKPKFAAPRQLVCFSSVSRLSRSAYALANAQSRLLRANRGPTPLPGTWGRDSG
jgi:hypothetical protein